MAVISDFHIHGFDVSSYQPAAPNFAANGRHFAIFKASEGTTYTDPHFGANRSAAHAQGMNAIGMYHFAHPGNNPVSDANHFLGVVGHPGPGEFAVLDYETSPWNQGWIATWGNTVKAAGWKVVFYTYAGMLSNPTDQVAQVFPDLWVAGYSTNAPGSDRWPHWTFWQHTDGQSSVGGNDGPWDCSVFYSNDINVLTQWSGGSAPGPQPPPQPSKEEPVGAYSLPILEPGESYTFRPPPAQGSGGIHFGAVFFSFGVDFATDPGVPLRIAIYDKTAKAWWVPYGGGSFDAQGTWHNESDAFPPLWVTTGGDIAAIQMDANHSKVSIVHCGKQGRIVPLIEYQT